MLLVIQYANTVAAGIQTAAAAYKMARYRSRLDSEYRVMRAAARFPILFQVQAMAHPITIPRTNAGATVRT